MLTSAALNGRCLICGVVGCRGHAGEPQHVIDRPGVSSMGEQPYIADRTLYLDANGKVVEADDPAKLTKLISPGLPLPMARARELGLVPEPEPEAKAVEAAPENKARTSSSRKAGK